MGALVILVVLGIVVALACIIPLVILKDKGKKVVLKESNCKQSESCTLQFEDEFLARVQVQTSVDTATGLVFYLFMQTFQQETLTSGCN